MCRLRNMRWRWAPARGLATPKIERMVAGGRQMETLLCGFLSCSVKEGVWRSRRSRAGEIIGPLPTDAWFLSRVPNQAPCLRMPRWPYHRRGESEGHARASHVRKRRMGPKPCQAATGPDYGRKRLLGRGATTRNARGAVRARAQQTGERNLARTASCGARTGAPLRPSPAL
jgi:hypothetical protein